MAKAKNGDKVKVHYTGRLTNGEQFDSSVGREPLAFTVGAGQMIKGFDSAIPGMEEGEKKTITIAPEDAYGPVNEEAIIEFPLKNIPDSLEIAVGMQLQLQSSAGYPVPVVVKEIREDVAVLDANHRLAGKELIFDIELVEIG
ncbi:MAG: peptidylprolyl isomerase [Chitinophagaceae bacterium]|nr:peptidylprolyl isomerase [Chitinophagaceae bacterium]